MGIYDQGPQIYAQMLQNGLDKQFQLANTAQPVSQFLTGLRQAQALKAQQDAMARQASQDEWQRQKFQQQIDYNQGRDQLNDKRYRDLADERSSDREDQLKQRAENNRQQRYKNFMDWYSNNVGTDTDPEAVKTAAQGFGVDPSTLEGAFLNKKTIQTEEGPVTDEYPLPTKVVMTATPGQGWTAMMQKAQDARQAKEDAAAQRDQFHADSLANQKFMQSIAASNNSLAKQRFDASQAEMSPEDYKAQEAAKLLREFAVKGNTPIDPKTGMPMDPSVAADQIAEKMKNMVYPQTHPRNPPPPAMVPKGQSQPGSAQDPLIGTKTKYPSGTKLKDGRTIQVLAGTIIGVE